MLDLLLIVLTDLDPGTPKPTDVKAGPLAFAVWIFLIFAVVVLGFSLVKQLRRAESNKRAGAFGDAPETDEPERDNDQQP